MAFKKFKHVPLYLEMAPAALFTSAPKGTEAVKVSATDSLAADDDTEAESATLYVKNCNLFTFIYPDQWLRYSFVELIGCIIIIVNFSTMEDSLRKVFADVGELRTVTIARKKAAGKSKEGIDHAPIPSPYTPCHLQPLLLDGMHTLWYRAW
jgi:RNA recognition motif-containing protein